MLGVSSTNLDAHHIIQMLLTWEIAAIMLLLHVLTAAVVGTRVFVFAYVQARREVKHLIDAIRRMREK